MTNPLNLVVERDCARFDLIYDAACKETEVDTLNLQLKELDQIYKRFCINVLDKGAEIPKGKYTMRITLDLDLVFRLSEIRNKIRKACGLPPASVLYDPLIHDVPGIENGIPLNLKMKAEDAAPTLALPSKCPPRPPKINPVVKGKVGFGNKAANCSFNALLQLLLHTPEHRAILQTVGEFYARGESFDEIISQRVIAHFEGPVSDERMKQGVQLFNSIESLFWKKKTLQALSKEKEIVNALLPKSLQEQEALKGLPGKRKRNDADCEAGEALLHAVSAYDAACAAGKPISPDVSQGVRMAFRHLYGAEIFNEKPFVHQDMHEALGCLMGSFEAIARCADLFPKTHAHMQTRRTFSAVGEPRAPDPKMINRTKIEEAGLERAPEYQIVLHLSKEDPDGITMEKLMDRFFLSTDSEEETVAFINKDGQEQDYAVEKTERMFLSAPSLLTVVISRNDYDTTFKKNTKLQTIVKVSCDPLTFPAQRTTLGIKLSYELEAFSTHSGTAAAGHYITYRNIEGDWVKFDDDKPQMKTRPQINSILNGPEAYVLNYRLSERGVIPTSPSSSSSSSSSVELE